MNLFKYILLFAQIILIFHFGQDKKSKIEGYYQATDHFSTGIVLYNDGFYCSFDHISLQWYYSVGAWTLAGDTVYLKEIEIIKDATNSSVYAFNLCFLK